MKNLVLTIISIIKVALLSKKRGILAIPEEDIPKTCVILGNGPSLNETFIKHRTLLESMNLMAVNSYATTSEYLNLKPKYYILNAPILFKPTHQLSALYTQLRNDILSNIAQKTNWKMYLFVPFVAKKSSYFKEILAQNSNIKPVYYNTTGVEGMANISAFFFNRGWGMPRPHNVIIPAIMTLIKINTKDIYIVGADHSWLSEISVNDKNEALVNQKHFYDENKTRPEKMEDYISRPRRLHEIIHKFYLSFKGYWEIKNYSSKKNVNIYNCSEVSMIDAFERRKLSDL